MLFSIPFSFLPIRCHRYIAKLATNKVMTKTRGQAQRARVNLKYCYPDMKPEQRESIVEKTLVTAATYLMRFPLLTLRSRRWLENNTEVFGLEHFEQAKQRGENVIFLVPHTWSVDVFAMLLASQGHPICTMVKSQKNPLSEWAMSKQRKQYGGRLYERSGGIKPFIKAIRDGYTGYFLPDQDHGPKQSLFVDFFATTKATLPVMGFISKSAKAKVLPIWASFDSDTGKFRVDVYPALEPFPTETPEQDALSMNLFIEQMCVERPHQYMWNLKLLQTQQDGTYIYNAKIETES